MVTHTTSVQDRESRLKPVPPGSVRLWRTHRGSVALPEAGATPWEREPLAHFPPDTSRIGVRTEASATQQLVLKLTKFVLASVATTM